MLTSNKNCFTSILTLLLLSMHEVSMQKSLSVSENTAKSGTFCNVILTDAFSLEVSIFKSAHAVGSETDGNTG